MKTFARLAIICSVMAFALILPSRAFADTGIQLRVPYQGVTNDGALKGGASGSGVLLSFGLDAGTTVGLLSEMINFTDNNVAGTYNVNAIRISKDILDPLFVAVDLGSAANAVRQATLADVAFGAHLLGSKGKVNSYLNVEVLYRILNPGASFVAGGTATNYGGVSLVIGAGLSF